jgi:hypothetical protein
VTTTPPSAGERIPHESRLGATALDRWTVGYAIVVAAIVGWRVPSQRLPVFLAVPVLLVTLALLMPRARRAGAIGRGLGDWYPLLLLTAVYTEVGLINLSHGRAFDRMVLGWEQTLFGFQPSRDWIRWHSSIWLSWILHLGYLAYYPIIVAAPLTLWLTGQREAMLRVMTTIVATFYLCYVVFVLFPVVGPRHVFPAADNAATQTAIAQLTARFLDHVAAWGAAFPSSHVAVGVAATIAAVHEWRALGLALVLPTALLTLGSVYGQFHYAVDALAGLGTGSMVAAGARLASRQGVTAQVDPRRRDALPVATAGGARISSCSQPPPDPRTPP